MSAETQTHVHARGRTGGTFFPVFFIAFSPMGPEFVSPQRIAAGGACAVPPGMGEDGGNRTKGYSR
ncbi:hypothetical protein [Streptomyces sp. NPDC058579]|uniref:hypothetical protein n=1 Tax=Streptomyces sp. NPDC058579 TaxID=3346548 RepID=UPI00365A575A